MDLVITMNSETISNWISVKDRLPDHGVTVLVVTSSKDFFTCRRSVIEDHNSAPEPLVGVRDKFTHWMPLPEPPKDECR